MLCISFNFPESVLVSFVLIRLFAGAAVLSGAVFFCFKGYFLFGVSLFSKNDMNNNPKIIASKKGSILGCISIFRKKGIP